MYAAVWQKDGSCIVQVGISPSHLLRELNHHEISEVVESMPMTDGMEICIAEADTGIICGATDQDNVGKTLEEAGLTSCDTSGRAVAKKIDGRYYRVMFDNYDEYVIGLISSYSSINKGLLLNMVIVLVYLCIFALLIFITMTILVRNRRANLKKLDELNRQKASQFEVLKSMSKMYLSMHLLDLNNETITEYGAIDIVKATYEAEEHVIHGPIADVMRTTMVNTVSDYSRDDIVEFTDINTIRQRMKNVKSMYRDFINIDNKWSRATFVTIESDEEGYPYLLVFAVQHVDEEKRKEEALLIKSNTDSLTRCFNRGAYDEEIARMEREGIPEDLIIIAMDVNGLKSINDSQGHYAGDELILGAVQCMRDAFGSLGKIYRTGGDEFILLLTCGEQTFAAAFKDFNSLTLGWTGRLVAQLSVSCGYVFYNEYSSLSLAEMEKITDNKMYKSKALYYANKGLDRRGLNAAYNALCDTYNKILRADLTNDRFQIIKMDVSEKNEQKGYSMKLSEWLRNFGTTGQVAEEDLENYLQHTDIEFLRKHFKENKDFKMFYRRKNGRLYQNVMMEISPAENYEDTNQVMYLYVKTLE